MRAARVKLREKEALSVRLDRSWIIISIGVTISTRSTKLSKLDNGKKRSRQWEEEKQKEVAAHLPDDERKMPRSSVGCPGKANTLDIQSFDGIAECKQCFIIYVAAKLEALKEDDRRHTMTQKPPEKKRKNL